MKRDGLCLSLSVKFPDDGIKPFHIFPAGTGIA